MATTSQILTLHAVPLHLSGNTTEEQNRKLLEFMNEATREACRTSLEALDRQGAQCVLDAHRKLKPELAAEMIAVIQKHTRVDKFKDEEVASDRIYPATYKVRPLAGQIAELRKVFPSLVTCNERITRKPLPEGSEAWFAIPRWETLAPTYNQAVEMVLTAIGTRRKISNRIIDKMGKANLRQCDRTVLAEKLLAEQQSGQDMLVIALQAGMLHRGCSARRTRVSMAGNEFGLGLFTLGCILLTHPERLANGETLMIDCGGDEYSVRGDFEFDRVPLFDFGIGGLECSVFYDDRARNCWGTPTGFLYKPV